MAAVEIFSSSISYSYKTKVFSTSALVVLIFIALSLITPLFIVYHSGGFWLKNRIHTETSDIAFEYKYMLIAERSFPIQPLICSSFVTYKENKINDDCMLVKVQEIDSNTDGKKDLLKFEAQLYTSESIKSLKLLLFFNFTLKHLINAVIESVAVFDYVLHEEVQSVQFLSDLSLHQRGLLHRDGLYEMYNHSIELKDVSLHELLRQSTDKKFSARLKDIQVTTQPGYAHTDPFILRGELFYMDYLIHYQPGLWEELKWAWVQYLSSLLIFTFLAQRVLTFLFTNRHLNSYIVLPWKDK